MRLNELGEDALVRKIRTRFPSPPGALGIGDDAAVVDLPSGSSVLYCSDLVVEGTHFLRDLHPPASVGYKSVAINVSDIGAMGGVPMFLTLSLALPGDLDVQWVDAFLDGVSRACDEFGVSLVGGDSSSALLIFADVSMIGRVVSGHAVRRSGARVGDGIYVTGTLGGSALGLDHLRSGNLRHPSIQRHLYPSPRHRVGFALADRAHAMIDISDGLSTDLSRVLDESRVSARLYKDRIPTDPQASDADVLHGGEEYELLITSSDLPSEVDGLPITRIGEVIEAGSASPRIFLVDGPRESLLQRRGYQHFSAR